MALTDPFGLVGQVLDGQFRVESYVGEGGFSIVYRGTHVGLNEPIAIKCLKLPGALGSALVESFVHRFRDESRLHYKLSQGNLHIARSIASGTTIAPATSALVPYAVLEWLEGQSLAQIFASRRAAGLRGRPLGEVVRLLDTAVDAVAFAHAQGVVHRDLNPGNLFLASTAAGPRLKVLDFGVAKVLADSTLAMGPTARTVGNVRMFAPAYGAPEQFDERLGKVGPWTDVYALGLVVLEALTDRTVMEGEHLGEYAMKALDPVRRPSPRAMGVSVGDDVEAILSRALALSPDARPRDAGEMWGTLKHAVSVDEASGFAPHAVHAGSEPPPPGTLRIPPVVTEGMSPAIEVTRVPSAPPASPPRRLNVTQPMAAPPARTATEALAATPPPPAMAPRGETPLPPPPRVPAFPGVPLAPSRPPAPSTPPPIFYRSSLRPPPPEPAPKGQVALLVVLLAIFLAALAYGGWLLTHPPHPPT